MNTAFALDYPYQDPSFVFAPFAGNDFAVFLDSSQINHDQARYSYIMMDPVQVWQNATTLFDDVQHFLRENKRPTLDDLPPFQGGICGYCGYELLHQIEQISEKDKDFFQIPDAILAYYDVVLAFDHQLEKAWIISQTGEERAFDFLDKIKKAHHRTQTTFHIPTSLNWTSSITQTDYIAKVDQVIEYIKAGDIFQANLTQRFEAILPLSFDTYAFYQHLRKKNPAPFSAFLSYENFKIASTSPERFIKASGLFIETCPIKGTRARSKDQQEDRHIIKELQNSNKDLAENTMIVDLLRNDLSKVAKPHSVHVPELCAVHSFATVHHLISTITAELKDNCDQIDLLKACFPGGSITGAPKVRAMEIINELEPCPRGVYCGSILYFGLNGEMDSSIVIRTLLFKDQKVALQVGGGIVYDSDSEKEYQETLDKADALFRAFYEAIE